ncbi:hypothetical protein BSKO_01324 [Bryopsis sp. KO-2023]|nr:hypothetical protein BSKO_01324 [Bryopsis sp. KO-2023]
MKFFPRRELGGEDYLNITSNRNKWVECAEFKAASTPPVVSGIQSGITLWKAIDVVFEHHLRVDPQEERSFIFVVVEDFDMNDKESWRRMGWGRQQTPFPYQKTSSSMRIVHQNSGDPEVVISDMVYERTDSEGRVIKFKVLKVEGVMKNSSGVHLLKRVWKNQSGSGVQFGFTPADPYAIQVQENKTLVTVEGLNEINGTHVVTSTVSSSGSFYVDKQREMEGENTTTSGFTQDIYNIDEAIGPRPIFRERFVVDPTQCMYHIWPIGEWRMPPPRAPLSGEIGWTGSQPAESPRHRDAIPGGSVASASTRCEDIDFPLRRARSPPIQEVKRLSVLEDTPPVSRNRATSVASRASSDQPWSMQDRVACQMKAIQEFTQILRNGLMSCARDILPANLAPEKFADQLLSEIPEVGEHVKDKGAHFVLDHEPLVSSIKQLITIKFQNETMSPIFCKSLDHHYKDLPTIGLSMASQELERLVEHSVDDSPRPQAFGSPADSPVGVENDQEGDIEELWRSFCSKPESVERFIKAIREWYGAQRVPEICNEPLPLAAAAVKVLGKTQVSTLIEHVEEQMRSSTNIDARGSEGHGAGTSGTGRVSGGGDRFGTSVEARERVGATESSMEFGSKLGLGQMRDQAGGVLSIPRLGSPVNLNETRQVRGVGDGAVGLGMQSGSLGSGVTGLGIGSGGGASNARLGNLGIGGTEGAGMSGGLGLGGLPGSTRLGSVGGSGVGIGGLGLGQAGIGGGAIGAGIGGIGGPGGAGIGGIGAAGGAGIGAGIGGIGAAGGAGIGGLGAGLGIPSRQRGVAGGGIGVPGIGALGGPGVGGGIGGLGGGGPGAGGPIPLELALMGGPDSIRMGVSTHGIMTKLNDYCRTQKSAGPLRRYQERAVAEAESGENIIFVAPTGSGKTKIFVEAARILLRKDPTRKVVVLSPTVPLATQNAAVFVVEGFVMEGFPVNSFSSDNPLPLQCWNLHLKSHSVMTMTPSVLQNVLEQGYGLPEDIDLLIFDECHHCKGEHPYAKIMAVIRSSYQNPNQKHRTQVLGFTASPAAKETLQETNNVLLELSQNMCAIFEIIAEEDEEVQLYAPTPTEETKLVQFRKEDYMFITNTSILLYSICCTKLELLSRELELPELPQQITVDFNQGNYCTQFENWCNRASNCLVKLSGPEQWDLCQTLQNLTFMNNMLGLVKEAGVESCLRAIAKFVEMQTYGNLASEIFSNFMQLPPMDDPEMWERASTVGSYSSGGFPKFVTLVEFLLRYKDTPQVHGIIFVRTRDAVYQLGQMLRSCPDITFMTFFEFTGHGAARKKNTPKTLIMGSIPGMTGNSQQLQLQGFSQQGQHVLIATSAAEEGIDIPSCEFVVRYTASESGTARVQSRGRTRVHGGLYLNIVEAESHEHRLLAKSVKEEQQMKQLLKILPSGR